MIYFMQPAEGGPVKIGCSKNVAKRRKELETHYGRRLVLLAVIPGNPETEAEIHHRFRHLRLRAAKEGRKPEQFRPAPDLMSFIGDPPSAACDPDTVELMRPVKRHAAVAGLALSSSPRRTDSSCGSNPEAFRCDVVARGDCHIRAEIDPEDRDNIRVIAAKMGMSMAAFARMAVLDRAAVEGAKR